MKLAAVVGPGELLEFFQGLVAEVAAVDEEEDAVRAGDLDKEGNEIDGGVGLLARELFPAWACKVKP